MDDRLIAFCLHLRVDLAHLLFYVVSITNCHYFDARSILGFGKRLRGEWFIGGIDCLGYGVNTLLASQIISTAFWLFDVRQGHQLGLRSILLGRWLAIGNV